MSIQEKLKELFDNIVEQVSAMEKPTDEEIRRYHEMAYGLYFSRGLKGGENEWGIDKKRIKNYIEFHLDKPCNPLILSSVLKCFDYNGYYYYYPKDESKLNKIKPYTGSDNYKYSRGQAYSIVLTKLKDLQALAEFLKDETAKEYYIICCSLLSSIKEGVTLEGVKKYLECKLGSECDSEIFGKVLEAFAQRQLVSYSVNIGTLYYLGETANALYLNKKVFGGNIQALVKPYQCSVEEAYRTSYPDTIEKINAEYQNVIDVVEADGVKYYKDGVNNLLSTYKSVIGGDNTKEYIHLLTRKWYFEGNETVERILSAYLEAALWENQDKNEVSFTALRALCFENYKGPVEEYQTISDDKYREYVLNNDDYSRYIENNSDDKEKQIEGYITFIKESEIFDRHGKYGRYWMPDIRRDSYYTDAVCNSFLKTIVDDVPNDPSEIYDIIWGRIELTDEERQRREENARERARKYQEYCAERDAKAQQKAEENKQNAAAAKEKDAEERRLRQEKERQANEEYLRKKQEDAQRYEEQRQLSKEFYVLYLDQYGNHRGYVNSYRLAGIKSLMEVEKYWSDQFNPRSYNLKFVKATESLLEYEQWTK